MEIRRTSSGFNAVWTAQRDGVDCTTELPAPERFRSKAVERLTSSRDPVDLEAAEMLGRCDLSYDVAVDDDGDEADRVGVVIAAPPDVAAILEDHSHLLTVTIMEALCEACPDLGGDRVVRKSEGAD